MENIRDIIDKLDTVEKTTLSNSSNPPNSNSESGSIKCNICGDLGWITPDVSIDHPDFGSHYPCVCRAQNSASTNEKRLKEYSNLSDLSDYTFDTLDPKGKHPKINSEVFKNAFKESFEYSIHPSNWLLISGPHASGKTHLAAAIANQCMKSGVPVFFIHSTDLVEELRRTNFNESHPSETFDMTSHVKLAPVLVLDDFSSSIQSNWAMDKLLAILNHRANLKLPTIITTAEKTESLHPFIKSRVGDNNLGKIIYTNSNSSEGSNLTIGELPPDIKRMTFNSFNTKGLPNSTNANKSSLETALKTAKIYAEHPEGWLTFYSPNTGCGKTHLAASISNQMLDNGQEVFFAVVPELMSYLGASISPNSSLDTESIFLQLKQSPFMVLDELGEERQTAWSQDKLAQLIVHRQNHHLPTIITTRMDIMDMAKKGSSIASRLLDPNMGQIIKIDSSDYRPGR